MEDPKESAYVYLERDSEDSYTRLIPIGERTLFHYEYSNCGMLEEWDPQLEKLPEGFYKITYSYYWDAEFCEGHRITPDYAVMDALLSIEPSFAARLISLKEWFQEKLYQLTIPFRKVWALEHCLGDFGSREENTWLPIALLKLLISKDFFDKETRRVTSLYW